MKRLVVISSYPPRGTTHHKSVIGGASYTKNTLVALKREIILRNETPEITVLAQEIEGEEKIYQDEGIIVNRIWRRNSLLTFNKLFGEISKNHKETKEVLIELELNIFGQSGIFLLLLLPFIFSLKLSGKKVILVIHEVIYDMEKFGAHINLKKGIRSAFYNKALSNFYKSVVKLSDKIIVFEESLKQKLSEITKNGKKITAIPIAVESVKHIISKEEAKDTLGISKNDFVIMTFGFLAWYKGTDWLSDIWDKDIAKENNLKLVIAGGANPNRLDLPYYKKYLKDMERACIEKNILLTGFVPEDRMHLYFSSSDLVVFPYRTMMSSSAVLSMAYSFEKPFLLSENMKQIFLNKDINEELRLSGLEQSDVLFPLDDSFQKRILQLKKNDNLLYKIAAFSKRMKKNRSWDLIGKKYYETIF